MKAKMQQLFSTYWSIDRKKRGQNVKNTGLILVLFAAMFFLGRGLAKVTLSQETVSDRAIQAESWGLGFGAEGSKPTGMTTTDELKKYNAYFMSDTTDKILYLTFDCGFENGNTQPILDALKKHNAKATFFVVGHFLESAPELVKQMVADGHTVGNHTYHHPDMSAISSKDAFYKEMNDVATLYEQVTGQKIANYYRPPRGIYSKQNLEMAKELGYNTFFWSLAYVDWYQDKQPTHEEAFKKLLTRVHPGAIVLLHNTSKTNGEILDELLTKWEGMGYTFHTLDEFTQ